MILVKYAIYNKGVQFINHFHFIFRCILNVQCLTKTTYSNANKRFAKYNIKIKTIAVLLFVQKYLYFYDSLVLEISIQ